MGHKRFRAPTIVVGTISAVSPVLFSLAEKAGLNIRKKEE